VLEQGAQVLGAILILAAYALAQMRRLDQDSYVYLLLNFLGGVLLGVLAYIGRDWGFLLLEGAWAGLSGWGIYRRWRNSAAPVRR
jgi:hypothetical protein